MSSRRCRVSDLAGRSQDGVWFSGAGNCLVFRQPSPQCGEITVLLDDADADLIAELRHQGAGGA